MEGMGSVTEIVGSRVVVWTEFMFISGKLSMSNSAGVMVVVSSSDVVETLLKLAGIGSRLEEDASSTFVEVGSVDVKVGVVSCLMSCVFVVNVSSSDVVETLLKLAGIGSGLEEDASSTFVVVGSVDVKVGVVSCSMS